MQLSAKHIFWVGAREKQTNKQKKKKTKIDMILSNQKGFHDKGES